MKTPIRYTIKKTVMLSFLTPQGQYDSLLDEGELELADVDGDGKYETIFYMNPDGTRHESITIANAIDMFLERGCIVVKNNP